MIKKYNLTLENAFLFRCIFFFLLFFIPFLNYMVSGIIDIQLSPLYFLTSILLGVGFRDQPRWLLLILSSSITFFRLYYTDIYTFNLPNLLLIEFVSLLVSFVSVQFTKNYLKSKKIKLDVIITLAKTLDSKDPYTASHSQNVAKYAVMIAKEMHLSNNLCNALYIGGLLHDIGKIGIPERILLKTGRLTDEEYYFIRKHPTIGYKTMEHISAFRENGVLDMVLYHHERYDGSGYPHGLKGEEIPLLARILGIADSFDAMTSRRVYRDQLDFNTVINEISNNKGLQFDPQIADIFLSILQRDGINIFKKTLDKNVGYGTSFILTEKFG